MSSRLSPFTRRKARIRHAIRLRAGGKPRLSVFKSGKYIYAQVIDDVLGKTIVSAATIEKDYRSSGKSTSNLSAATYVGNLIAERALRAGIKDVVFDRSGYAYHGKVAALAQASRSSGLVF